MMPNPENKIEDAKPTNYQQLPNHVIDLEEKK